MVVVGEPKHYDDAWGPAVSVAIDVDGHTFELRWKVSEGPVASGAEPFLAAALALAMRVGEPLRIAGPVSPRLLAGTAKIQDIINSWYPGFRRIAIEPQAQNPVESAPSRGIGCFFSGGVDSFYSVLKHRDEITKLIFVHGFDIRLDDIPLRERVSGAIREAAAELGKPLIEVETNLRELSNGYAEWGAHYHGAALASVALLLSPQFQEIYIPSTHDYSHLRPFGSHPLLDPLWSTEATEILHDGCEVTKFQKMTRIAWSPTVAKYLRTCWRNWDGAYNCCRCERCLYTMVALRALGTLGRYPTFSRALDLAQVRSMPMESINGPITLRECLRLVEERGDDPELAQVLGERLSQATPPRREQEELLSRQLGERDAEIATLKELVAGYERGRAMRVLNALGRFRQRVISRVS